MERALASMVQDSNEAERIHIPVLREEAVGALGCRENGIYVDCTIGPGGHAEHLLRRCSHLRLLLGIDKDEESLSIAQDRFSHYGARVKLIHGDFGCLASLLQERGIAAVDGFLYDLGVSSLQLDSPHRGFSFLKDGPLDMRMDRQGALTAAHLVNGAAQERLEAILRDYGEEVWARRIARSIVDARGRIPITTTRQLAEIVAAAIPARFRPTRIHPATRTFLAFRIAVNNELDALAKSLGDAVSLLREGGRVCVISYHSLEDRIVKQVFKKMARGCICPPTSPVCTCGRRPQIKILTPRPVKPSAREIEANPRARSAKMRVAEKLREVEP